MIQPSPFVLPLIFRQPYRARTMSANGSVLATIQTNRLRQRPFQSVPEIHSVQDRVQEIGNRAVTAVLGVGMMPRMMFRSLQNPDVLQERNDRSIFLT